MFCELVTQLVTASVCRQFQEYITIIIRSLFYMHICAKFVRHIHGVLVGHTRSLNNTRLIVTKQEIN